MNFQITYQARTEEEFRRLFAEFGEAVKPTKTRRTDAELLAGMTLEEKAAGMTIADIEPGRAPIPKSKAKDAPSVSPAPSVSLSDGEEYG
jgi:hypothetical protein